MRINQISIKGYRSFDHTGEIIEFPDIKTPISIVGFNNAGKTNIIEAIKLACGIRDTWNKWDKCTVDDFHLNNTTSNVEIDVQFSEAIPIPTIYGKDKDIECWGAELKIFYTDEQVEAYNYALDKDGKLLRRQSQLRSSAPPLLFTRYKNLLNIFYIDFKDLDKHLKINSYSLLGKVLEDIKKDFNLKTNKTKTKDNEEISRKDYYEKLLNYIEEKILKTEKLEKFLETIESSIKSQLNLGEDSVDFIFKFPSADEFFDSMQFKLADHNDKPALPINNLGDGFKSMLIIAILRVLLQADEGGKIMIMDEPETYLHEHFQDFFYQILCQLAQKNQIIYTTHSKKFVDMFKPESIIRVDNTEYLQSKIIQSKKEELELPDGPWIKNPKDFAKYLRSLEPNLGNILFANKVIIVEGPHDILAYRTIFQDKVDFGLKNIAIVAAWSKDSIISIIDLCKEFEIEYFVIHDWDLDSDTDPNTLPEPTQEKEKQKLTKDKQQWTKNKKILEKIGNENLRHCNKINLEDALDIERNQKGTISIYEKLNGKNLDDIKKDFPNLISENLLGFLGIS